jgi:hypothetical protein
MKVPYFPSAPMKVLYFSSTWSSRRKVTFPETKKKEKMLKVDPSLPYERPPPLGVDSPPPPRSTPLPLGVDLDPGLMESIRCQTSSSCYCLGPCAIGAPDPGASSPPPKPLAQRHRAAAPDPTEATGPMSQPPPPPLGLGAGGSAQLQI